MIRRRSLLAGAAGVPMAAGLAAPAVAQGVRPLRFVPQANLTVLDPIVTTAAVTQNHGYYVFDTLYAVGADQVPKPQMAEGHTVSDDGRTVRIRLREGLRFHDGEPVLARDAAASLARWAKRDVFGQVADSRVDSWGVADDRTIEIKLKRPFALLIDAIAKPTANVTLVMPERIARTDPFTPITEMVGSGPYRFVREEFVPGSRVVYAKNQNYVPRQEPPDWQTGAKVAHFDRIEWHIIPDPATAAAALQNNEVDWWEQPLVDLLPTLARVRGMTIAPLDQTNYLGIIRFNHLQPPFNNVRLRQAVQMAVNQEDYMQANVGSDRSLWNTNYSLFTRGLPLYDESGPGAARMMGPRNLDAARAAVRASGYNGEKIVIINPTDFATIAPLGRVTHDLFRRLGLNSDLIETDWGTVVQRRASKEAVERGGWSVFHTWWPGISLITPVANNLLRGNGEQGGWFGWFTNAKNEGLLQEWVDAPDPAAARRIALAMNIEAMDQVSTVPLGQFQIRTAYRGLTGVLPGTAPYPWNVRRV
jgi:peptide/nickel transport system substrate-binding protein